MQEALLNPYSRVRYEGVDSKIVVMGNSGVGKTSLLQRYTNNKFTRHTTSTSGALFVTKKVTVAGLKVRLQLWDTAGQERFRSMAPMYYRGANAALLLYDITDKASFNDIRGWLEELRKNCSPDLIIYIVGSKSDLHLRRQVTQDLARLSLHNWFPPPRQPTPPPQITQSSSTTLSYIRPRFTSFPGLTNKSSSPSPTPPPPPPPPHPHPPISLPFDPSSSGVTSANSLSRSKTSSSNSNSGTGSRPRRTSAGATVLARSKTLSSPTSPTSPSTTTTTNNNTTTTATTPTHRWSSHFIPWNNNDNDNSSNSLNEEDENDGGDDDNHDTDVEKEWGLYPGMELFEVSAKDNTGISDLFEHIIKAIIERLDKIEAENEQKKRDSVFLSSVATPGWSAQADEEEAREKAAAAAANGGGVIGIGRSSSSHSCC